MKQPHTHPIIRRHALITKGVPNDQGDAIIQAAAETLTTLAKQWPAATLREDLRPAPGTYPAAPTRGKLDLGQVITVPSALFAAHSTKEAA